MRNNYADNDAEASFGVITTDASNQIIEAAQEDQFWVVDWVTISGEASGAKTVSIKFGSDAEWTAVVHANTVEHFTFNPPLYANGRTKNEALIVNGTAGAIVSIRYR
jgi:hypothetical protein